MFGWTLTALVEDHPNLLATWHVWFHRHTEGTQPLRSKEKRTQLINKLAENIFKWPTTKWTFVSSFIDQLITLFSHQWIISLLTVSVLGSASTGQGLHPRDCHHSLSFLHLTPLEVSWLHPGVWTGKFQEVNRLSLFWSLVKHQVGAYPIKSLGVLLATSPGWDTSPLQVTSSILSFYPENSLPAICTSARREVLWE